MTNKIASLAFIIILLCFSFSLADETFTFHSYPNVYVPDEGEPPIADTINIPSHIIINDINFYVGIETNSMNGSLIIDVVSPTADVVRLDDHNHLRIYLNCWFDTEEEEDGPGSLDDYVGLNAHGQWIMRVSRWAGFGEFFMWDSWAIEVIGEPINSVDDPNLPLQTGLNIIYPNPFNSNTIIHYSLASPSDIQLDIYDVLGRVVTRFVVNDLSAGYHQLTWDGTNGSGDPVSSGIYFARLNVTSENSSQSFSKKMVLLK